MKLYQSSKNVSTFRNLKSMAFLALFLGCHLAMATIYEYPNNLAPGTKEPFVVQESGIIQQTSLNDLKMNYDTWYIFDIDNTLIAPDNVMIGSHQWGDYMAKVIGWELQNQIFNFTQEFIPTKMSSPLALDLVTKADGHYPFFALTARPSYMKDRTLMQLKKHFEGHFEDIRQNVVFSGTTAKGVLVATLFQEAKIKPKRIVFFDDRRYNLESVEESLKSLPVQFDGYRYNVLDDEVSKFNPEIANVQWILLKTQHHVYTNEEVKRMIFTSGEF